MSTANGDTLRLMKERGELAEGRPGKLSHAATVSLDDLGFTRSQSRTWPELVALALAAHRDGIGWERFWPTVAADCRRLQVVCPCSHHSLYGRLLAIAVSGTEIVEPPGGLELSEGGGSSHGDDGNRNQRRVLGPRTHSIRPSEELEPQQ